MDSCSRRVGAGRPARCRHSHPPASAHPFPILLPILLVLAATAPIFAGGPFRALSPPAEAQPAIESDGDAHWWDGFDSVHGLENRASALAVYENTIIVGGWFAEAGGQVTPAIARWSGGGWQPLGTGLGDAVYALHPYENKLIAGGDFLSAGAAPVSRIAAWNGTEWTALGSGMNESVYALTSLGGALVAGGNFTAAGGDTSCKHVAWWDGLAWNAFGSGGMNMPVYALTIHDGCVIAGGVFTEAGGVPCAYIAKLCDGAHWEPLGSGMNGGVWALGEYNGDLIAGGSFTTAGGVNVKRVARWDGTSWHALGVNEAVGTNGTVSAFTVFDDHLIVGGFFNLAGSVAASNIARWDGGDWRTLGSGTDGAATCLASRAESLFVGGGFTSAGGKEAFHIAKWVGAVTAVELASFTAERRGRAVEVRWEVAEEHDHAGFHLFRSDSGDRRIQLTSRLLSGQRAYRFIDQSAPDTETSYWLQEVSRGGEATWLGPVVAPAGSVRAPAPAILGTSPNPFRASTVCTFTVPGPGPARVTVLDAQGRVVCTLSDRAGDAGVHEAVWDGRDGSGALAASGVYFVRVEWNGEALGARVVLSR